MLNFERELADLRPLLGDRVTDALIVRERREVFSVLPEVRFCAWAGAMLLATAAGIVLKNNYQRIGPLALAIAMGVLAAGCYVWVWRHRDRASIADDSVLLLGALLLSGDVAFVESQFHLLGDAWYRHFLIVGIAHGAGAYLYRSRTLLSLSIVALAAWMGIEKGVLTSYTPDEFSMRALGLAVLMGMWRLANRREEFHPTLEHFGANFLILAAFAQMFDDARRLPAALVTMALGGAIVVWGFRTLRESFVLYGFAYAIIAFDVILVQYLPDGLGYLTILGTTIVAIALLFVIHARFQELRRA